jgi:hypothetical protein
MPKLIFHQVPGKNDAVFLEEQNNRAAAGAEKSFWLTFLQK